MIMLTKLDGTPMLVNEDQLQYAEATPDTMLVLHNGMRLMVKEPLSAVIERSEEFRRRTRPGLGPAPASTPELPVEK